MKSNRFVIDRIHAKARPRHLRNGHTYNPTENYEYELLVYWAYQSQTDGHVFEGPVRVTMTFTFVRPKSVKREKPTVRPDLDNIIKSVFDGLNSHKDKNTGMVIPGAWIDDSQVCRIIAEKRYGDKEQVEVVIQGG